VAKFIKTKITPKFNVGHTKKAQTGKPRRGSGKTGGRGGNAWRGYVGGSSGFVPFTGQF
jgi:hypothetical protein